MRLHLRGRSARLIGRPTTITVAFDVNAGPTTVSAVDRTEAFIQIATWAWSLKKASVEVATSSSIDPSFTGLTPGTDYTLTLTVTSIYGSTASFTFGDFTVDPELLPTPTAPTPGTVSGLTIPLTIELPSNPEMVAERRLFYKNGSAPTTSDSFVGIALDDTSYDFVADATGTWHFKLQDIAVTPFAQDSALSADASAIIPVAGSAPSAPTLNTVTAVSSHNLTLAWTIGANIGDGNHGVYRVAGNDPSFSPDSTPLTGNRIAAELSAATSSYVDTSVAPETQYTYKVEAVNSSGQAFSSGVAQTTPEQEEWPDNEPATMDTLILFVDGTTKDIGQGVFYPGNGWNIATLDDGVTPRIQVVSDASAKFGSVLRKNFEPGDTAHWNGLFTKSSFSASGFSELYYRVVMRFSDNFELHPSGQKIFYHGFKGNSSTPKMHAVMIKGGGQIFHNCSFATGSCSPGAKQYESIGSSGIIGKGVFVTVELYLVAQSAPGVADGRADLWVNGNLITEWRRPASSTWRTLEGDWVNGVTQRENIMWVPPCAPGHLLTGLEAFGYWGGASPPVKTVTDYWDISEIYISGKA